MRAAFWSAGQGQGSGQLTLGDGPGSSSSTVPQGGWAGTGCAARRCGPGSLEEGGTQNQGSSPVTIPDTLPPPTPGTVLGETPKLPGSESNGMTQTWPFKGL